MKWHKDLGTSASATNYYVGRKNGWHFKISEGMRMDTRIGVFAHPRDEKVDIRYNSFWEFTKGFESLDAAKEFCENWIYEQHKDYCLGNDVK